LSWDFYYNDVLNVMLVNGSNLSASSLIHLQRTSNLNRIREIKFKHVCILHVYSNTDYSCRNVNAVKGLIIKANLSWSQTQAKFYQLTASLSVILH